MNILLACDSNVERAGVCLFILQWVRGIRSVYQDGEITIYFRKKVLNSDLAEEFYKLRATIVTGELPENETSASRNNRRKVRQDIRNILQKVHYDVVHVNSSAIGYSCLVLSEAKRAHVPVRISHSHGRNLGNGLKNVYLWFLRIILKSHATKLAGCSIDAGVYLFGKSGVNSDRWMFVPNTIDVEKYSFKVCDREKRRTEIGVSNDVVLIGATGQLIVRKNHIFLIGVIDELKRNNKNAKLIVLGEGNQREYLEHQIEALNLKHDVFLLGESNDIPEWLSAMDIYAMPSLTEGLPIGAVEAQANGLYCLLSDGVPNDVDISSSVIHLPIGDSIDKWVETISNLSIKTTAQRLEGAAIVSDAGFSSTKASDYVKALYE